MTGHKSQHFVPKSYLKAWCDPTALANYDPYVWIFDKDGFNPRRKAPHNIFYETDLYTIAREGGRNLVLEHGLAQLESRFVSIRDGKLDRFQPLDETDHVYLCAFIAAMQARNPVQRDHQSKQWGEVLSMMDQLKKYMRTATAEQKQAVVSVPRAQTDRDRSFGYDQVKAMAERPLQTMMAPMIASLTRHLPRLDCAVLTCSGDARFITSDNPCVWSDPDAHNRPPMQQSPALMYETIEITLPISPRQAVLLNRRGVSGFQSAARSIVDEVNRITRFSCDEHFVSNSNAAEPCWFDPGEEPEDSWERQNR